MPFADDYTIPLPAMYVDGADPAVTYTDGRVKAGRLWLDTSTGATGTLKKRNAANDGWDILIDLDQVGYINIPQNSQSVNYTAVIADRGKHLFHPTADNNPRTFTIPANASVAFPVGTALTFVNKINALTIAITTDTLTWAEDGSTGSRSLAANGMATALKITSTEWLISGTGLS